MYKYSSKIRSNLIAKKGNPHNLLVIILFQQLISRISASPIYYFDKNIFIVQKISRCKCDKDHICTYERTDMKMRIYRHSCTPKDSKEYD